MESADAVQTTWGIGRRRRQRGQATGMPGALADASVVSGQAGGDDCPGRERDMGFAELGRLHHRRGVRPGGRTLSGLERRLAGEVCAGGGGEHSTRLAAGGGLAALAWRAAGCLEGGEARAWHTGEGFSYRQMCGTASRGAVSSICGKGAFCREAPIGCSGARGVEDAYSTLRLRCSMEAC